MVALARGSHSGKNSAGDNLDAPHRIVHERAAGQDAEGGSPASDPRSPAFYMRGNVVLASPAFYLYVAKRLQQDQNWNAAFLVDASARIGSLAAFRGITFEAVALAFIEQGFTANVHSLQSGTMTKETFGPAERVEWKDSSELAAHAASLSLRGTDTLFVPRARNAAGLDAVLYRHKSRSFVLLDMTVSSSHGVHVSGLHDAVTKLG
jgi:hypothetical protein